MKQRQHRNRLLVSSDRPISSNGSYESNGGHFEGHLGSNAGKKKKTRRRWETIGMISDGGVHVVSRGRQDITR